MTISGGHVLDISDKCSDLFGGSLEYSITEKDFVVEVNIEADEEFGGRRFEGIVEEALDTIEDTFKLEGFSILPEMNSEERQDESDDRALDLHRDR
jgi:hypothetical protein